MKTPYFDYRAQDYDTEHLALELNVERVDQLIVDYILHYSRIPLNLCDMGAGTGRLASKILPHCPHHHITLIDFSHEMLAKAAANLKDYKNVTLRHEDLRTVSFDPYSFDIIFAALSLHHLTFSERATLYRKVHSTLKPGGAFIIHEHAHDELPGCWRTIYDARRRNRRTHALASRNVKQSSLDAARDIINTASPEEEKDKVGADRFSVKHDELSLRSAGFREVVLIWRDLSDVVIFSNQ